MKKIYFYQKSPRRRSTPRRDNSGLENLHGDNSGVEDLHGDNSGVEDLHGDNSGVKDLYGDEGVPGGIRRPSKRVWTGFPGINNMYQ